MSDSFKFFNKLNFLKKNKIALYGCHLPLDLHNGFGNNILLCKVLNLNNLKRFGKYKKISAISYQGTLKKSCSIKSIANQLNKELRTKCLVLPFGKKQIKKIAPVKKVNWNCH